MNKGKQSFMEKYNKTLESGKFRWLNEMLYSNTSDESYNTFQKNKELFKEYHYGYHDQVSKWPVNPLDIIIRYILDKKNKQLIVADFGCGEAKLAKIISHYKPDAKVDAFNIVKRSYKADNAAAVISSSKEELKSSKANENEKVINGYEYDGKTVFSFDLVAANKFVTECNIANVPLANESVDIAVYCLSLMGTDYMKFIREGYRVLRKNGELVVAEVKSRFVQSIDNKNDENDNTGEEGPSSSKSEWKRPPNFKFNAKFAMKRGIKQFAEILESEGFRLVRKDDGNRMFVIFYLVKDASKKMIKQVENKKESGAKQTQSHSKKRSRDFDDSDDSDAGHGSGDKNQNRAFDDGRDRKKRRRRNKNGNKYQDQSKEGNHAPKENGMKLKGCVYKKR